MCLNELQHHRSQQEHSDQVGHSHETVEGIADAPDQTKINSSAHNGNQSIGNVEGQQDLASQQELCAAGTVQTPAQDRGESEAAHGNSSENGDPVTVDSGESGNGQLCAGSLAVGNGYTAQQNDQSGHGADDDGVHEHFEDTKHALLGRIVGVGAGVGNGTGTETGFVGEDAAGNALLHADEEAAHDTAGDGGGIECTLENGGENSRNTADVQNDQTDTQGDVQHSHEGNQPLGDPADALDTADEDQGNNDADDDADNKVTGRSPGGGQQTVVQQGSINGGGDGIDLCGVAGAENSADTEEGVQVSKPHPLAAETVFDVVHGTANEVTLGIALPEVDSQGHFGELGAHAKQSRDPHPEYGTGTANGDGTGHTGDVTGTDGGCQSGADCLEGGDGTLSSLIFFQNTADGVFHGITELTDLDKTGTQGDVKTHTDDAGHGRHAPDEVVQKLVDVGDDFQHDVSPWVKIGKPVKVFRSKEIAHIISES